MWGEWVKAQQWRNGITLQGQVLLRILKKQYDFFHFQVVFILIFYNLKDSWEYLWEAQTPRNSE